jgi:hypothetical protein
MTNHWLFRVGDGEHFISSMKKSVWGFYSTPPCGKYFLKNAKEGDILWFVKSGGLLAWVATFTQVKERVLGPLIALTESNEELGWVKQEGNWDMEVHYKDLYDIISLELNSEIKSPLTIRLYNIKCKVNLLEEYPLIVRYSKVTKI